VPSSLIYLALLETFSQYRVSILFLSFIYLYDTDAISSISLGSAVAVERIFSGGRDTISLRRSSLKPETIRTLMLVKQRLRLARTAIQDILGD
jgi:hAT family C-terminal dimerisation region